MAYFYAGFFTDDGQPDNARACFRSAEFEDSVPRSTSTRAIGCCRITSTFSHHKLAATVRMLKTRAGQRQEHQAAALQSQSQRIVHRRVRSRPGEVRHRPICEELRFAPCLRTSFPFASQPPHELPGCPMRRFEFPGDNARRRMMDHILANKAVFKSATDIAGNAPSSVARFWRASRIGTAR